MNVSQVVFLRRNVHIILQRHDFVKKTEQEYEAEINIGEWVMQVMKIECPLPSEDW